MTNFVWLSVDPVRNEINFYPKHISEKIENELINGLNQSYLGINFFNATVHFDSNNNHYQTTSSVSFSARHGFKVPGYRSVKRISITEENQAVKIFCYKVNSETRITNNIEQSQFILESIIPKECIVNNIQNNNIDIKFKHWCPNDLIEENSSKSVIVWQWCRGTYEYNGNLFNLSDKWWIPYLYDQNLIIEEAYSNNLNNIDIKLIDNSEKNIQFINNSIFGRQIDNNTENERIIRRKIITIDELKIIINNEKKLPLQINIEDLSEVPQEFICCISQNIMCDPVTTVDGFTYDRNSIERWFNISDKSPLTGLIIESKVLIENNLLKEQINNYLKN